MTQVAIIRWFNNISITKKLYFVIGIMALLIAIELFALWFSVNTLSSIRAYVGGEGLWSKGQKDALYHLSRYANKGEEKDYKAFLEFMKVPLGDKKARIELEKADPDFAVIRQGFLEGHNHQDDIDGMIKLFRRFRKVYYFDKAIAIWTKADPIIAKLNPIGEQLKKEISSGAPSREKINQIILEITPINEKLTLLENDFSFTLGEGSRWLEHLILKILLFIALTVEIAGLVFTTSISKAITKGINELMRVSKEVIKGNYKGKATVYSNDEIGVLAESFNTMTHDLEEKSNKLKQSSWYTRSLIEASLDPFVTVSTDGKVMDVNEASVKVTGISREQLIGTDFLNYFTDAERVKDGYQQVFEKGFVRDYELTIKHKNGKLTDVLCNASVYMDENGNVLGMFAAARDITERKKIEKELKSKTIQLAEAQHLAHIGSWEWDLLTNKVAWSDELYRILGLTPHEFEPGYEKYLEVLHPDDKNYVDGIVRQALKNRKPYYFFHKIIRPDGRKRIINATGKVFTESNGNAIRMAGTIQDVTEEKIAQEKLIKAKEKADVLNNDLISAIKENRELENFTFIASHDLQEPLVTIGNFTGLLEKKYNGKSDKEIHRYLKFIVDATSKMKNLIKDLLDFSIIGRNSIFEPVDCNKIFNEVISEMEESIKKSNAKITSSFLPVLKGNEIEFKVLFQNLISNALKFCKKNVRPEIEITVEQKDNEYIFAFKDNGIGIDEQYKDKLFVVFQRLNQTAEYPGTGIGLATCKKIVMVNNGKIWVKSVLGEGSTFYFSIPKENRNKLAAAN